jgi:anti-anti-sigma factor
MDPVSDLPGTVSDLSGVPEAGALDTGTALGLSVTQPAPGLRLVEVAGELDSLTAATLRDRLDEQLVARPAHLVIDLAAVTFMGSAALAVLLQCSAQLPPGSTLHLSGTVRRAVHRPLMVTGLLPLFNTYLTLVDALTHIASTPGSAPVPLAEGPQR